MIFSINGKKFKGAACHFGGFFPYIILYNSQEIGKHSSPEMLNLNTMKNITTDPNQSSDFHPAVQLIWLAGKVGQQCKIKSQSYKCSRTMLLSTFYNKGLCFAMSFYLIVKSLQKLLTVACKWL